MGYKLDNTLEDRFVYDKHLIRFCVAVQTNIRGKSEVATSWVPLNPDGNKLGPGTSQVFYAEHVLKTFDFWLDEFKIIIIQKEYPVNVKGLRFLVMLFAEETGIVPDFLRDFR